jgi:uncharacterized membrane protein YdjX (TVP38/TMEM64 family)
MRFRSYAAASLIGMVLPVIGIVYVGDTLLSNPGRSAAVFTGLVVWSAIPPGVFLAVVGGRALWNRLHRRPPEADPLPEETAPEQPPVSAGRPD